MMREQTHDLDEVAPGDEPGCPRTHLFHSPGDGADFGLHRPRAKSVLLADVLDSFFNGIEQGIPPVKWPVGEGWGTLALRPNRIITVGAPANVGKTPLLMNLAWQAMEITPTLRVLVANNESTVEELNELLTAMLGGINLGHIQDHDLAYCAPEKLARARAALQTVAGRLEFMEMPFTLEQVAERAAEFRADVIVIDTLQKLRLEGYDGEAGDRVGRIMPLLRDVALQGRCVMAAAQISREGVVHVQKRAGSRTHDDRDLNVFLHNSEIESASNDAFVLAYEKGARVYQGVDEEYEPIPMWLQHVKGRNNMKAHIPLLFDGRYQKFTLRQVGNSAAAGQEGPRVGAGTSPAGETGGRERSAARVSSKISKPTPPGADHAGHEWVT